MNTRQIQNQRLSTETTQAFERTPTSNHEQYSSMCNSQHNAAMHCFLLSIWLGAKNSLIFFFKYFIPVLFTNDTTQNKSGLTKKKTPAWYPQVTWFNFSRFMLCIDWCTDSLVRRKSFPINKNLFQEIYTNWLELVVLFQYTQK